MNLAENNFWRTFGIAVTVHTIQQQKTYFKINKKQAGTAFKVQTLCWINGQPCNKKTEIDRLKPV
jgi:hypothetical protein